MKELQTAHVDALKAQEKELKCEAAEDLERTRLEAENEAQRRLDSQAERLKAEAAKRASIFQGKTQQYVVFPGGAAAVLVDLTKPQQRQLTGVFVCVCVCVCVCVWQVYGDY